MPSICSGYRCTKTQLILCIACSVFRERGFQAGEIDEHVLRSMDTMKVRLSVSRELATHFAENFVIDPANFYSKDENYQRYMKHLEKCY